MTDTVPFVLSVDTEEDNWIPARAGWTTENVRELPAVAARLARIGIRLTYFTTYAVAGDQRSFDLVQEAADAWGGEIAAHLHPWNTPPVGGPPPPLDTMLCNYNVAFQAAKLSTVTRVLEERLGHRPTAFRAGRFGLNADTVCALESHGYAVDSSVTPFFSWSPYDGGPDFVGAPLACYRIGPAGDVRRPTPSAPIVEVPLSAGYTRFTPAQWGILASRFARPSWRRLRLPSLAARTGFGRRAILSPETNPLRDLVALSRRLIDARVGHLQMFLHSSSLRPGLSPFAPMGRDVERMLVTIERYLERMAACVRLEPATVTEVGVGALRRDATGSCLSGSPKVVR